MNDHMQLHVSYLSVSYSPVDLGVFYDSEIPHFFAQNFQVLRKFLFHDTEALYWSA